MSAVRHLASTRALVIDLYEAGWKPSEIERVLDADGIPVPSRNTMWTWTHPKKAEAAAARDRLVGRRWRVGVATFAWPGVRSPEWRVGRMLALRNAGLTFDAIARVMTMDFPAEPLSEAQVSADIARGRPSARRRKVRRDGSLPRHSRRKTGEPVARVCSSCREPWLDEARRGRPHTRCPGCRAGNGAVAA